MFDAFKFRRWSQNIAWLAYAIGITEHNAIAVLSHMRPGERATAAGNPLVMSALRREIAAELFIPKKDLR